MKNVAASSLAVLTLLALASFAAAMERDGVQYPDRITVNGTELVLNGLGTREATLFKVNVYVAALYLENPSSNGYAICDSDETKRLVLHFVRGVGIDDITNAWSEGFEKNTEDMSPYSDRLNTLNSWMSGMEDGDEMTFTYLPGTGLEVSVKGSFKGTVEGDDFASVFFSIWLGDDPPNGGLREGLLGLD
ncbi:MAG: hypothetical protein GF388_04705 [Candidatus Aegiribacteria sp.]|nr:hypothetical protein [Candidatus Aegiribacteria sp.]MBD3294527.1 hypothetical protein [Candidatus Fermentibacteria bacterium]